MEFKALSLAAVFLAHAGYLIIKLVVKWDFQKLTVNQAAKLSVSLIIVGWLAYYFNRPDPRNLWIFIVLYGYLLIPFLHRRNFKLLAKSFPKSSVALPTLTLILFIAPLALKSNTNSFKRTYEYISEAYLSDNHEAANYLGDFAQKTYRRAISAKGALPKKYSCQPFVWIYERIFIYHADFIRAFELWFAAGCF